MISSKPVSDVLTTSNTYSHAYPNISGPYREPWRYRIKETWKDRNGRKYMKRQDEKFRKWVQAGESGKSRRRLEDLDSTDDEMDFEFPRSNGYPMTNDEWDECCRLEFLRKQVEQIHRHRPTPSPSPSPPRTPGPGKCLNGLKAECDMPAEVQLDTPTKQLNPQQHVNPQAKDHLRGCLRDPHELREYFDGLDSAPSGEPHNHPKVPNEIIINDQPIKETFGREPGTADGRPNGTFRSLKRKFVEFEYDSEGPSEISRTSFNPSDQAEAYSASVQHAMKKRKYNLQGDNAKLLTHASPRFNDTSKQQKPVVDGECENEEGGNQSSLSPPSLKIIRKIHETTHDVLNPHKHKATRPGTRSRKRPLVSLDSSKVGRVVVETAPGKYEVMSIDKYAERQSALMR